ncbi:MAG TPA: c-type cytochrome [Solirubrobacteraceae bacterium]|nr:c-type cytochrome [Solirubrobacteraceae bacterium]
MRRLTTICTLAAAALLAGTAPAGAQPQSGIVRPASEPPYPTLHLGSELFAGNCASCHGVDGSGVNVPRAGSGSVPGAGPSLRGVGALAADFYLRTGYMPLSSIHDQPGPDRVLFSDKEIRSLVAYVASLGTGPGIPHPQPNSTLIAQGLHLFTDHCAGCHQEVAEGGFVTGALVPPLQSATPTEIAEAVRIGPYLMPRFSTRQISNAQLNAIITYVLSTRHPPNQGGWGIGNLGPVPEGIITWFLAVPLLIVVCRMLGERLHS